MATALWWVRRDLRLADNQALARALAAAERVVPVFVVDPALTASDRVARNRLAFLWGGLSALADDLAARGSRLVVRRGDPAEALSRLVSETGARLVVAEEDATPYARRRDRGVARAVPLESVSGIGVHPLGAVRKGDGSPYVVFSPFLRAWRGLPLPGRGDLLGVPASLPGVGQVASERLPEGPPLGAGVPFRPGEAEAAARLAAFVRDGAEAPVYRYGGERDRPDLDGTSRLSPYLRFGMLSPRTAAAATRDCIEHAVSPEARRSAEAWLAELAWRDFYQAVLFHFPEVARGAFREELGAVAWRDAPEDLQAWKDGRTGYPLVDAAMRQLEATGWMHNRARMVVASFLAKDLLLDWRDGEAHFMRRLVDGDPASNNGGWQWAAGTGTDAAPYFRVFNPTTQARRHDPRGSYIRRWLPELRDVPDRHVHAPWRMGPDEQRATGCCIGRDYPEPIVDHGVARARALDAYGRAGRRR